MEKTLIDINDSFIKLIQLFHVKKEWFQGKTLLG